MFTVFVRLFISSLSSTKTEHVIDIQLGRLQITDDNLWIQVWWAVTLCHWVSA